MGSQNELIQIREAFKIPDSVVISVLPRLNIFSSDIGKPNNKYDINQTVYTDPELYKSQLGTPVYTNIEFLSKNYETKTKGLFKDTPGRKEVGANDGKDKSALVFEAVLLTVNQAKKIVKTEIQGRDGTVKEYIGMGDYEISINGVITGGNGHYPIDEVARLKQMLDAPVPIPVVSTYLNNLGINLLVVESYELAQVAGGYSYQTFSITCTSDVPQELRLTNV